jgi:hypothetical protein
MRRFQFRLRTLMIVVTLLAAVCAYVAHEAEIVRERDAVRADLKKYGWVSASHLKPVPFVRQWLGDEGYSMILLPRGMSDDYIARIKAVFPESTFRTSNWPTTFDFNHLPESRPAQSAIQP